MLVDKAAFILEQAKKLGASQAEVSCAAEKGFSIVIRGGDTETVEHHLSYGVGISVYFDQRSASVTVSDFSESALQLAVEKACSMVKFTECDPCAGLADAALMAKEFPNLSLSHPWSITVDDAILHAQACEEIALAQSDLISQSEGVSLSTQSGEYCYANSYGFNNSVHASQHSMSCTLLAKQNDVMERDYSYSVARDARDLLAIDGLAELAVSRTISRLGARSIKTQKTPVIFAADLSRGLVGHFISAIHGNSLYRNASFLKDHLGKQVFSRSVNVFERPYLAKALGSSAYDRDGVATRNQNFVTDGVLESYVLNSYSARKLGMVTTANAGGLHNGFITAGDLSFEALLKKMDRGLLVTEVIGQGVNIVTGDYSRGAFGYWVENGVVQYPVSGITIAGNLRDMFLNVIDISSDVDRNGNIQAGSILIDEMTIAGSM